MGQKRKIERIFIANRGEIAVRIIHTCKEMGIETVVAFCPADKGSLFTLMANYSFEFKSDSLKESYLNADLLISIAQQYSCDAIHPGYGFLSENATFANLCHKNQICFIGPDSTTISLMGDKISARKKVAELGIPLLPSIKLTDDQKIDSSIELPVLIKASAGGGGRGMRIVKNEKDLEESLKAAQSEALNAFGDGTVYVEKYLEKCRHIEVQVLSDAHGNHIHLFERECSIQRRHQKVIEEAPSSILNEKQRKAICDAALTITKGINYLNAGTIEFLWADEQFYFLEMNTRLQVEHAVTEMITGIDLVKAQILIADGNNLSNFLPKVTLHGYAIEARIYAENPENNFLPTRGTVSKVGSINIPNTRVESSFLDNLKVPLQFDSMLAKVCAWAPSREDAATKLVYCLKKVPFAGVTNNNLYIQTILNSKPFLERETYTNFIEKFTPAKEEKVPVELLAAAIVKLNTSESIKEENFYNPWLSHD
ncbi:MAG: ATP-grasp domain-containing protein [Lentisphaerales bacterium]|nr:ATP-grasp domain-containing protein [Lentisphaerales bacterium]